MKSPVGRSALPQPASLLALISELHVLAIDLVLYQQGLDTTLLKSGLCRTVKLRRVTSCIEREWLSYLNSMWPWNRWVDHA
jgi:hypothetical protein